MQCQRNMTLSIEWDHPVVRSMCPQGIMPSEKATNSPGLCPVKGQKPSLGTSFTLRTVQIHDPGTSTKYTNLSQQA